MAIPSLPSAFLLCLLLLLVEIRHGSTSTALVGQVSQVAGSSLFSLKLPIGTPPQTQSLIFDVEGQISTVKCGHGGFQPNLSSTFKQLLVKCVPSPSPPPATCGTIARDSVTLNTTDGTRPLKPFTVPGVDFKCVAGSGSAALSAAADALPALLSANAHLASRTFAYCLPGAAAFPGPVFFGHLPTYTFQSGPPVNVSGVLSSTPLTISAPPRPATFSIALQSIVVNGNIRFLAPADLHISTLQPYTKLEASLYRSLRSAFRQAIGYGNTTKAKPPVAPFDTCFDSSHFASTRVGPSVPEVELHLKGGSVWSIFGDNSVVAFDNGAVFCLAFVDAGVGQPSVLGNFQQIDNFLEYNLDRSVLRFSGPLAFYRTLCNDFLF